MYKNLVLFTYIIILLYNPLAKAEALEVGKVRFEDHWVEVELPQTPSEFARGLMFRRELTPNKGMLFVFKKESRYKFFMKNMLIPLDMIWMDKDKRVVFIKKNAQPCKGKECPAIFPDRPAMYVLEVKAGTAEDIGLKIGDRLELFI